MTMNALDTARSSQYDSINILERTNPGLKEIEKARDAAKTAAKILDAAVVLMGYGIYTVASEPRDVKFADPADYKIEMPEVQAPGTLPDLLGDFADLSPDDQTAKFDEVLSFLGHLDSSITTATWNDDEWAAAFAEDRASAYMKLVYALEHRVPTSVAVPTDEEMDTWTAQFDPPAAAATMPDELGQFDSWSDEDAQDEYTRRLDDLVLLVGGTVDLAPWDNAWGTDHKDAFTRLLVAESREPKTLDVPTDEERDGWLGQFTEPVAEAEEAPEDPRQVMARFEAMLDQLEDMGVEQAGLMHKHWKKARKAWVLFFSGDAAAALALLEQVLAAPVTSWEVPAPGKAVA